MNPSHVRVDPSLARPAYTTFAGEGVVKTLAQGAPAALGVPAHEAANLRVMEAQAARNGEEIVASSIEIQYGFNPQTGRLEVVGGRSRALHGPKKDGAAASGAAGEVAGGAAGEVAGAAEAEGEKAGAAGTASAKTGATGKEGGAGAAGDAGAPSEDEADERLRLLEDLSTLLEGQLGTLDAKRRDEEDQGRPDAAARIRDKQADLKQKIEDLTRERKRLEAEKEAARTARQLEEVNAVVGQAVTDSTNAALGLAKGAATAKLGGPAAGGSAAAGDQQRVPKPPRKIGGGIFTPSFTLSGFFVNTSI